MTMVQLASSLGRRGLRRALALCCAAGLGAAAHSGQGGISSEGGSRDEGSVATSPQVATAAGDTASRPLPWSPTKNLYYKRTWGVEIVGIKPVSSGYMLAFRYRVVDPQLAAILNDGHTKPYVIDDATKTVLAVPAMENVGELRQGAAPQRDRTYFMIFGNPGKLVKSGGTVSIVAGSFRLDGLLVQ